MKTSFDSGPHVRDDLCCLGVMYTCGHSATCMYDEDWKAQHDRMHRWDYLPETIFWFSVCIAIFVAIVTR